MEEQIHESNDFFNYRKEHWATRLYYSAFFGGLIATNGFSIKRNVVETLGHWDFAYDFVVCTGLVYLTVYFIYWVCLVLDKALPWEKNPDNRFIAQLILGVMIGYQFMELLNSLYVAYGGQNLLHTQKRKTEIPISLLLSLTVNCYYFGIYFAEKHFKKKVKKRDDIGDPSGATENLGNGGSGNTDQPSEEELTTDPSLHQSGVESPIYQPEKEKLPLITYSDGERILLKHLDIAAVGLENGNLAIYTFSDKCYYDTMPLKHFFELLDPNDYYHTSRQTIVHRGAVRSIAPSKTKKGGVEVSLTIDAEIRIEVAARSVARFKAWLAAGSPPSARKRSIPVPMLF